MKKVMQSVIVSGLVANSAFSAVFVVPEKVQNYKVQTDQTFYDLYQNQDSVIAGASDDTQRAKLNNMDTSSKIVTGSTINKVGVNMTEGSPIKGGTTGSLIIAGKKYNISIDKKGNSTIVGYGSDGKSRVILQGDMAVNKTRVYCTKSINVTFSNGFRSGCTQQGRDAQEIYFDLPTGTLSVSHVQQNRDYSCGKYGCSPTNNWHTTNVKKIDRISINSYDILSNKEIQLREVSFTQRAVNLEGNGKFNHQS